MGMTIDKAKSVINELKLYVEDLHSYSADDVSETLEFVIKALEQTMWIPVSKELPEENIHVLCQFYMGGMAECYHAHGAWHIVGGYRISCDEVVAWMPLPQPYRESEVNADDD